jgi:hypothetical protein
MTHPAPQSIGPLRVSLGVLASGVLLLAGLTSAAGRAATRPSIDQPPLTVNLQASCSGVGTDLPAQRARLQQAYTTDFPLFQQRLAALVTTNNNIGGMVVRFPLQEKVVYRGSILSGNPTCLTQLRQAGKVETIVNLYSGNLVDEDRLAAEEQATFARLKGHSYVHILHFLDRLAPGETMAEMERRIASIIRLIEVTAGNVLIHCVGGWHRTGLIYGVMQKCINETPMPLVIEEYKRHTGWQSAQQPVFFRAGDVDLLQRFDCRRAGLLPR